MKQATFSHCGSLTSLAANPCQIIKIVCGKNDVEICKLLDTRSNSTNGLKIDKIGQKLIENGQNKSN